jgi:hypothetical protein
MYNDTPGLSPDKIAPTVGQNSTQYIPAPSSLDTHSLRTHLIQPGRYPCPLPCSNSGISEANAGSGPFGRSTTATATPLSTSSMRSTTSDSAKGGRSSVRSLPLSPPYFWYHPRERPQTEKRDSVGLQTRSSRPHRSSASRSFC